MKVLWAGSMSSVSFVFTMVGRRLSDLLREITPVFVKGFICWLVGFNLAVLGLSCGSRIFGLGCAM